jgi:hypothetical protein
MQTWRNELRTWGNQYASALAKREGVLGVIMGGSLARGQEWRHSDLELGTLLAKANPDLPYFNIDSGRGVEMIQLAQDELAEQIRLVEAGD